MSLFSAGGLKLWWASRITDLLQVQVVPDDGHSQYACNKCTRRIESLERAVLDLDAFRKQVGKSYHSLTPSETHSKRTKHASGNAITPETAPQAKWLMLTSAGRRLDFGTSSIECKNQNHYKNKF